jgi:hypothetical protein
MPEWGVLRLVNRLAKHVGIMYIVHGGGRLAVFNGLQKIHQYSDEKSAKL